MSIAAAYPARLARAALPVRASNPETIRDRVLDFSAVRRITARKSKKTALEKPQFRFVFQG
jgi:hypothetical protein